MKFQLQKASVIGDTPEMIHVEPESFDELKTLERLLKDHRSMVIGYGRLPGSMELIHMQLAVPSNSPNNPPPKKDAPMDRQHIQRLLPVIQAYAEGKDIQFRSDTGQWVDTPSPTFAWAPGCYRVKSEEGPRIATTWDSVPPVVTGEGEHISTRLLKKKYEDAIDVAEALREYADAIPDEVEFTFAMPEIDRDWVDYVLSKDNRA